MNPAQAGEAPLKHDWWYVAIDETRHWNIPESDKVHIERILGVYFYDASVGVHCCELTPSYYLQALGSTIYFKLDTPSDVLERITDEYSQELSGGEDCYMHCRVIDGMDSKWKSHYGTVEDEDTEEDEAEVVRESHNGNPRF